MLDAARPDLAGRIWRTDSASKLRTKAARPVRRPQVCHRGSVVIPHWPSNFLKCPLVFESLLQLAKDLARGLLSIKRLALLVASTLHQFRNVHAQVGPHEAP